MEKTLSSQLIEASCVLLCGMLLGAIYQLLSCVRRRTGTAAALMCDVLFCCTAACAMFLLGMGPGGGELRFYMPVAALGGAAVYYACFGPAADTIFVRFLDRLGKMLLPLKRMLGYIGKILSSRVKNLKNIFSFARKRITIAIIGKLKKLTSTDGAEVTDNEAEKSKHIY